MPLSTFIALPLVDKDHSESREGQHQRNEGARLLNHRRDTHRALLLACANLRTAQWATEEWSEHAKVEAPGRQGHETDNRHDGPGRALEHKQTQCDKHNARNYASDPTSSGSHERAERIHGGPPQWVEPKKSVPFLG